MESNAYPAYINLADKSPTTEGSTNSNKVRDVLITRLVHQSHSNISAPRMMPTNPENSRTWMRKAGQPQIPNIS
jgi:hypothetical protein